VPLEKPDAARGKEKGGVVVQAGAFKDREKAETRRKKMEKAGFSVRLSRSGKDGESGLYLVLAGPYPDRESARGAVSRLKSEQKIDAILQQKD
jgi:cell division protein FtsN